MQWNRFVKGLCKYLNIQVTLRDEMLLQRVLGASFFLLLLFFYYLSILSSSSSSSQTPLILVSCRLSSSLNSSAASAPSSPASKGPTNLSARSGSLVASLDVKRIYCSLTNPSAPSCSASPSPSPAPSLSPSSTNRRPSQGTSSFELF